jgi:hypothetical protein
MGEDRREDGDYGDDDVFGGGEIQRAEQAYRGAVAVAGDAVALPGRWRLNWGALCGVVALRTGAIPFGVTIRF